MVSLAENRIYARTSFNFVCRIPRSLWAWFFLLVTLFRLIPATFVSRPVGKVCEMVSTPLSQYPYHAKLGMLWACAVAITFGTAFGAARPSVRSFFFLKKKLIFKTLNHLSGHVNPRPSNLTFRHILHPTRPSINVPRQKIHQLVRHPPLHHPPTSLSAFHPPR